MIPINRLPTEMPLDLETTDALTHQLNESGIDGLLTNLATQLRGEGKYHELFEVLKMQQRTRLGLPAVQFPDEPEISRELRDQLDDALIEVCREIGQLFMARGDIQEGWMYLRPAGESRLAASMLEKVEPNDENLDTLIGILLSEGVDPRRGFELVLDRYGTCNAITTFESEMARRGRQDQRHGASLLVQHIHSELHTNVRHDIARRESTSKDENDVERIANELEKESLVDLLRDRDFLFEDHAYHIDTTHLGSIVRFSKLLDDEPSLRLAWELTEYGRRLSSQYQYEGDEPFADVFADHARFLKVLMGQDVEEGLSFFKEKAQTIDAHTKGTMAAEVYVDLLCRTRRFDEAVGASIEMLQGRQSMGIAPSLVEICRDAGQYDRLLEYCRDNSDLLGFGTGLLLSSDTR